MAYAVALSGGVASGKSAVTAQLSQMGIEVIDADLVSREVIAPGTPGFAEVVAHFGPTVVAEDGSLDRRGLRERIFANDADRRALEEIVHPRVRAELRARAAASSADVVVLAIPLLVESGHYDWVDRTVMVDVGIETQRQRLMLRDHVDAALASRMLAAQAPRSRRLAIADEVIVNNGTLFELSDQVSAAASRWRASAITRTR
jgi:dephospho-CoA kinase